MNFRKSASRYGLPVLGMVGLLSLHVWAGSLAWAQNPPQQSSERPPYRVAERTRPNADEIRAMLTPQPNEHPLMPTLRLARFGLQQMEKLQDYSCILLKRQRIEGKLTEPEFTFVKIRQKPFSVYMRFLAPPAVKGQETIYVEGANHGKMWAHGTGVKKMFGTVELEPTGPIAMRGNLYPITELGVQNLIRRLIEVGDKDTQYGECEVKCFQGAKINNRPHTYIQVVHPVPRRNFLFHEARIFIDDELNLPTRFESYDWPSQRGGPPEEIEEYTYLNMKLNNGFGDLDFDIHNPAYGFKR